MENMEVKALALISSPDATPMLRRVLTNVGVTLEMVDDEDSLLERIRRGRYEGVIVDCTTQGDGFNLLKTLRSEASVRSSIVFALVENKQAMRQAFESGATFTIEKPLSLDRTNRCFRAAYGLIVGEGRRYYRHHINLAVEVDRKGEAITTAISTDISSGGISLDTPAQLPADSAVQLRFALPGTRARLEVSGEVIWAREKRAGVRFTKMGRRTREQLVTWLNERYEQEMAITQRATQNFSLTVN